MAFVQQLLMCVPQGQGLAKDDGPQQKQDDQDCGPYSAIGGFTAAAALGLEHLLCAISSTSSAAIRNRGKGRLKREPRRG